MTDLTASAQSILDSRSLTFDLVLAASQGDDKVRAGLAQQIWTLIHDLGSVEYDIQRLAAQISATLDRVNRSLEAGMHVNSLGELQSTGVSYDRACTKRQFLIDQLSVLTSVFSKALQDCIRECGHKAVPGQDDCVECQAELVRQMED